MTFQLVRGYSVYLNGTWVSVFDNVPGGGGGGDPVPDGFVPDATKPLWFGTNNAANNVGCKIGVARTTVSTLAAAAAAGYKNLNLSFQVTATTPGVTWENCRFTYGYSGNGNGGMYYQMISATNNVPTRFLFCEFEPDSINDRYNAVYGHDLYLYRCAITKSVDGFGLYNSTAANLNAEIASCWVGYLAWYDDDSGNGTRPGGHNDLTGTHNDGIQHGSGTNVNIHGSFWQGAKFHALNPGALTLTASGGYTLSSGNGLTPFMVSPPNSGTDANKCAQQGQIFLGQHSAYYHVGSITYRKNWLWNFDNGFKLQSARTSTVSPEFSSGFSLVPDVTLEDNIFGGTPRNWGGSQLYYPVRYDNNCVVNGVRRAGGSVITDTDGNVWDASANVAATYGDGQPIAGHPIRHRVDTVTAV